MLMTASVTTSLIEQSFLVGYCGGVVARLGCGTGANSCCVQICQQLLLVFGPTAARQAAVDDCEQRAIYAWWVTLEAQGAKNLMGALDTNGYHYPPG